MKKVAFTIAAVSLVSGAVFADHITINGGVSTPGDTAGGYNVVTIAGKTCKLATSKKVSSDLQATGSGPVPSSQGCNYVITVGNGPTFNVITEQNNGCPKACAP